MAISTYEYQKPDRTYTLDQYISCQSDTLMCYFNTSFRDTVGNITYSTYNVVSDYLDELRSDDYTVMVSLTDEQLVKYKYRPKLLCFDIYGNTELYFIILLINDMYSTKQFIKRKLRMPTASMMKLICKRIINANFRPINQYVKNKGRF